MTIKTNHVAYDLGLFIGITDSDTYELSRDDARSLLAHIDAQAARIAELERLLHLSAASFSNERTITVNLSARLEQAEKELAALREKEIEINDDMALAFHHAISDGALGTDNIEEIKTGLRAAFSHINSAPAAVPDEMNFSDAVNFVHINGIPCEDRPTLAMRVWNACRAEVLRLNSGSVKDE